MRKQKASRHPRKGIKASRDGAAPPLAASRPHPSSLIPQSSSPHNFRGRGGFTLTELMIAVLVLIVIILATSRIFSAASRVASIGKATSDVLQDAATIERQLRQDIAALSHEGFFAIRCVMVRNDTNQGLFPTAAAPLINPLLPPEAFIRADQLMFFTTGAESSQAFVASQGTNRKAQSNAACVYYGHAFQLPAASAKTQQMLPDLSTPDGELYIDSEATFANLGAGVYPWSFDDSGAAGDLPIILVDQNAVFVDDLGENVQGTQPNALQWLLSRQAVLLADDGGDVETYLDQGASAQTLWKPQLPSGATSLSLPIRNGRRDAVATQMNDIRDYILRHPTTGDMRGWVEQRIEMAAAMSYPRAERIAPTMRRGDQALTNSVLGSACSSFRIDWTYADGVGNQTNGNGVFHGGMVVPPGEQPWFGVDPMFDPNTPAADWPDSQTGVLTFIQYMNFLNAEGYLPFSSTLIFSLPSPPTAEAANVEHFNLGLATLGVSWPLPEEPDDSNARVRVYEAFFGYNQDVALGPPEGGPGGIPPGSPSAPVPGFPPEPSMSDQPRLDLGYTPWPTAIRVTMTLHDTESRLEAGREFQFVIKLPQRAGTP